MGVLDFLFEGRPPASVTTYGQTVQNVPSWLSDYTQGLIARANAVAAEPYQTYGGPRLAGFSPLQTAAFDRTIGSVGQSSPFIRQALSTTENLPGQGALTQAINFLPETLESTRSATSGPGALSLASPYLSAAGRTYPQAVSEYMDPYVGNVINRASDLATRTFTERFLPSLSSTFIRGGQYGSTAHQEQAQRGARDILENLQSQAGTMLSDAYRTGAATFGADQGRLGALGQTIGSLRAGDIDTSLRSAAQTGALAQSLGQLGLSSGELGLRGAAQTGALAQALQGLNFRDAAALEAIGQQQQQFGQRNLDLAYQDFLSQRDYPRQQVDWLSNIIRGIPSSAIPTAATTASTGPASIYQPSPLAQVASLASGIRGLSELGSGG